jgi:hypothetical protein
MRLNNNCWDASASGDVELRSISESASTSFAGDGQ